MEARAQRGGELQRSDSEASDSTIGQTTQSIAPKKTEVSAPQQHCNKRRPRPPRKEREREREREGAKPHQKEERELSSNGALLKGGGANILIVQLIGGPGFTHVDLQMIQYGSNMVYLMHLIFSPQ